MPEPVLLLLILGNDLLCEAFDVFLGCVVRGHIVVTRPSLDHTILDQNSDFW
jgi:hypothetical protein